MVRSKKAVKKVARRKGRLNIILDEDLKNWAHQYAMDNHTSLTSMITSYFVFLQKKEHVINAEQI